MLGVVTIGWGGAFLVGSLATLIYLDARATGGSIYLIEVAIAVLRLEFFVVSGFAFGYLIARWYSPIVALVWSVLWVFVLPLEYAALVPSSATNLEYFLFPALTALPHRALAWPVAVVAGWWVMVVGALGMVILGWARRAAGGTWTLLGSGVAVTLVVAGTGFGLPRLLPDVFVDRAGEPLACQEGARLEFCVSAEQAVVLPEMIARVEPVLDRMGDALPPDLRAVVSDSAAPAVLASGLEPHEFLTLNVGTAGIPYVEFDVAVSLGGLSECDTGRPETAWAFAFGQWLVPDGPRGLESSPELDALLAATDEDVLAWYSSNEEAIRACGYLGAGPVSR